MPGALQGLKIVDMTIVALGPYATMLLAEQGAEVIKVESPDGDTTRHVGPSKVNKGMGPHHLFVNRNKRSLCLDLKQPAAREALFKVIAGADALIYSIRPQAMVRLGLGYDAVREVNPGICYIGACGYASDGPYGHLPAYDDAIQALSGVAALMGGNGEPRYAPTVMADKTVGLTLAYAALCALMHKVRTGEGQKVEVPMFETMVTWLALEHLWERTFTDDGALGYPRTLAPSRKPYRARDGWLAILPYTDRHWRKFFEIAGRPEVMDEPRFATMNARSQHVEEMYGLIESLAPQKTVAEWVTVLEAAEVPCMPVKSLAELFDDPHLKWRGLFRKTQHHSEGELTMPISPLMFSATPGAHHRGAPLLGEDSRAILREAGVPESEIAALAENSAMIAPSPPAQRGEREGPTRSVGG
ncbi:CoA transferase [Vineibacter terrae]|uniref:CaiB/BaiF CoA transferase family protein n=1 Tax=Vineibacter terrae TaxID=2586908 RepID=UPI002E33EBFE|nr:CoA transferase [Vineibacter terrae]HEX2892154.1 CoA transferase [Vineibacter terrae]